MKMQKTARRQQKLDVVRPSQPDPVVSVAMASYISQQRKENAVEKGPKPLNHIRDLEAEVEASEVEIARRELSKTAITSLTCSGCGVRLQVRNMRCGQCEIF